MSDKIKFLDRQTISDIFDSLGGVDRFLKDFGYQQFAFAIESWVHENNQFPDASEKLDAQRYRWLRDPILTDDFPPGHGSCWVVQYHHPQGTIPELRSAGFGPKLDCNIDSVMQKDKA